MHFFNIILALIIAKPSSKLDQCAWYWIQYNIDVFFGTVLNWAVMKFLDWMFNKCKCTVRREFFINIEDGYRELF